MLGLLPGWNSMLLRILSFAFVAIIMPTPIGRPGVGCRTSR